jgi:signal transduction histidine kinase
MRLGIKAKQVAAVTATVGLAVVGLSLLQLAALARVSLQASREQGLLLVNAIFSRAQQVVPTSTDPYVALREDPGLQSVLGSSTFSQGVTYAAIVDPSGVAIAHSYPSEVGKRLPPAGDLKALLARNGLAIYQALHGSQQTLELSEPLRLSSGARFGSIRIGMSTVLVRKDVDKAIESALLTALVALGVAIVLAIGLAQLILRPIHVIRGGLSRLSKGEFGVTLDMPHQDEFGELGSFFNSVSAQLSADRSLLAGEKAKLESVVEHLEDAVAIFNPAGDLLFANPSMRATLPPDCLARPLDDIFPAGHVYRKLVADTLASGQSIGPVSAAPPAGAAAPAGEGVGAPGGERLVMTNAIKGVDGGLVGVMLVARNLEYLSRVQSTLNYSRKLAALGRLSAGVAHEVKNPLNAMAIHLELLKGKLESVRAVALGQQDALAEAGTAPRGEPLHDVRAAAIAAVTAPAPFDAPAVLEHVKIIAGEIRRLDEVLQGFLKFNRPEDLRLQPIDLGALLDDVVRVVGAEAQASRVQVTVDCPDTVPDISGDPAMLRQAFLNLAINACQAMPSGGALRIAARGARGRYVEVSFEDSGVGISQEHLEKIFNLYFTTKSKGSGIGLSMVYRTVQLHDGDIEVQSTPGTGTTFRLLLPQL